MHIHLLVDAPLTTVHGLRSGRPAHALHNAWSHAWIDAQVGADASPIVLPLMRHQDKRSPVTDQALGASKTSRTANGDETKVDRAAPQQRVMVMCMV